jgi:hypothetical protein
MNISLPGEMCLGHGAWAWNMQIPTHPRMRRNSTAANRGLLPAMTEVV